MNLYNHTSAYPINTFKLNKLKKLNLLLFYIISTVAFGQNADQMYHINTVGKTAILKKGHLKLGSNISPNGDTLDINSYYFIKNHQPWYPIMGEMHYNRVPREQWEESILKMKAAGIEIIASYVTWIYHEEEKGEYDFTGQRNLKAFIQLCKKHHLYVHLRLGPWVHGEVRNGGFPDWLQERGRKNLRNNSQEYLNDVNKFWFQVSEQAKGLYFKDGGPIIGIQIENEFRFNNPNGLEHMLTLKNMAIELGFDVPYYTATGWPGSDLSQNELIPVWGQYPAAPWTTNTRKLKLIDGYTFGPLKNDPNIGIDLLGSNDNTKITNHYQYPYATAEMGGGNQVTYHRRPIITSNDLLGIHYCMVGSGANLMGYYMFHGGSNLIGKYSTLQESKATGYPNDCPLISYDFQSPIGEYGQLTPAFNEFKILHSFLNHFGHLLCTYTPSFPNQIPSGASDNSVLRMAARSNGESGFVFINNYQRHLKTKSFKGVKFTIDLNDNQHLSFPNPGMDIMVNTQMILPFNMDLDGITLKYATVQPLYELNTSTKTYVFFIPEGVAPELSFRKDNIHKLIAQGITIKEYGDSYLLQNLKVDNQSLIEIYKTDSTKVNLLILNKTDALNSYQYKLNGEDKLIISTDQLLISDSIISFNSSDPAFQISIYPKTNDLNFENLKTLEDYDGIFSHYHTTLKKHKEIKVKMKPISYAKIKKTSTHIPLDDKQKEVSLKNPGPQYQTTIVDVKDAKYWKINIPKLNDPHINNAFLTIDYKGDTGSLYKKGILVADDFYQGKEVILGLRKFDFKSSQNQFIFQLIPLTNEREIYFEDGVKSQILQSSQKIDQINIKMQYNAKMY